MIFEIAWKKILVNEGSIYSKKKISLMIIFSDKKLLLILVTNLDINLWNKKFIDY